MIRLFPTSAVLSILFPLLAAAQVRPATPKDATPVPASVGRFSVTVYSTADPANFDPRHLDHSLPGFAVIREIRKLPLVRGQNTVKFTNVAAGIDPTTVSFKSLTAPDSTAVLEQDYENDLLTPETLLKKYVGRNIIINRKQEPAPGDHNRMPETIEAKLLALTDTQLVLLTNNKQLPFQIIPRNADITEIKLFDLQTGLTTTPTLVWKVTTDQPGDHDVLVSYQTANLTWRADYSLTLDKDQTIGRLGAWVTLVNQSGADYPSAHVKLVAGDVHRITRPPQVEALRAADKNLPAPGQFNTKPMFEYHTYALARTTSLINGATKQIELFPARSGLPITREYVYAAAAPQPAWPAAPLLSRQPLPPNHKVDVYLQLANTEKAGLGMALPAGRVRISQSAQADSQPADDFPEAPEFIGEDKIDHTARDQQISLRAGSAFDLVGQRRQTDFAASADQKIMTETIEIKLANHKSTPVTILVREPLYRWSQWEITASSEKYEKRDSRTIQFPVQLNPAEEKSVTYTVKYAW